MLSSAALRWPSASVVNNDENACLLASPRLDKKENASSTPVARLFTASWYVVSPARNDASTSSFAARNSSSFCCASSVSRFISMLLRPATSIVSDSSSRSTSSFGSSIFCRNFCVRASSPCNPRSLASADGMTTCGCIGGSARCALPSNTTRSLKNSLAAFASGPVIFVSMAKPSASVCAFSNVRAASSNCCAFCAVTCLSCNSPCSFVSSPDATCLSISSC